MTQLREPGSDETQMIPGVGAHRADADPDETTVIPAVVDNLADLDQHA
jgi:hypothetical protein